MQFTKACIWAPSTCARQTGDVCDWPSLCVHLNRPRLEKTVVGCSMWFSHHHINPNSHIQTIESRKRIGCASHANAVFKWTWPSKTGRLNLFYLQRYTHYSNSNISLISREIYTRARPCLWWNRTQRVSPFDGCLWSLWTDMCLARGLGRQYQLASISPSKGLGFRWFLHEIQSTPMPFVHSTW